ncbi:MAG: glycosyltransferase [Bacteroidetes bacterium]|nr:glycosyltransferase [Bacteroidota bacterium]HET6244686.1 hypothetical protein [Bacteroidia bacterium]
MRVLLLTLYYPPLNNIASLRLQAFEEFLVKEGIQVDVITRHYNQEQLNNTSLLIANESAESFKQSYLKKDNIIYTNFDKVSFPLKISQILPPFIKGIFNYLMKDVYHYGWLKYVNEAFEKELKSNKYDFIIASYGPPISLVAAKKMSEKYNIPWIADFRDIFIDERDKSYHLFCKKIVQNQLLKNASGFLFSSKGMEDYFFKHARPPLKEKPFSLVYNGVNSTHVAMIASKDNAIVKQFQALKQSYNKVLLHTGSLYIGQDVDFFIKALNKFNEDNKEQIALVFIGLADKSYVKTHDNEKIFILDKVQHSTSLYLQKLADALVLPVWNGRYTGLSGKTFEYLHSGNTVLCGPNPQEDLLFFVLQSSNAEVLKDYASFKLAMENLKDQTTIKRVELNILQRSYWVHKLANFLKELKLKSSDSGREKLKIG